MFLRLTSLTLALALGSACAGPYKLRPGQTALEEVATSTRQWTGIAVSKEGRTFVNYPRWSQPVPFSVGELQADGSVVPWPNTEINKWEPGQDPAEHFVCVQSVHVDAKDRLWILDPANPKFGGVVDGGPKLVQMDLLTNAVVKVIHLDSSVAPKKSYLNDVRIDVATETAYITDSGEGALLVVDLASGTARRLLAGNPALDAEDLTITIGTRRMTNPDGSPRKVHSDGIALSKKADYLYWQALTGRTVYRIPTQLLRDDTLTDDQLALRIEKVVESGVADGIEFGRDGWLYMTALEDSAIRRWSPKTQALEDVVRDERLAWPDSFAVGPDGVLRVTTAQIHLTPGTTEPYRIFKVRRMTGAEKKAAATASPAGP